MIKKIESSRRRLRDKPHDVSGSDIATERNLKAYEEDTVARTRDRQREKGRKCPYLANEKVLLTLQNTRMFSLFNEGHLSPGPCQFLPLHYFPRFLSSSAQQPRVIDLVSRLERHSERIPLIALM